MNEQRIRQIVREEIAAQQERQKVFLKLDSESITNGVKTGSILARAIRDKTPKVRL